jgi:hypothetical protein
MEKTVLLTSLVAAGLLALPLVMSNSSQQRDVARIEAQRTDDTLRLHSLFEASEATTDSLRYEFEVNKQGASGTSTSRQGGEFMPTAGSADTLSTVQVGVETGDTVVARLRVTGPEGLVAEADLREVIR